MQNIKHLINTCEKVGHNCLAFLEKSQNFNTFFKNSVIATITPRWYGKLIHKQIIEIGFFSLPVVGLTAVFTGAVLALQTYAGCARFGAETTVPTVVILGITRELGPTIVGLMVAGRIAASIAAEIGTMRVTEQIDALKTLSTNPFKYLVAPRIIASTLTLPILVLIADIIGVMGGTIASVLSLGFDFLPYINNSINYLTFQDVYSGLVKAVAFGFIIALIGCYNGYNSKGGAEGVGKATTNAVVWSSILILLSNYLITQLFFI